MPLLVETSEKGRPFPFSARVLGGKMRKCEHRECITNRKKWLRSQRHVSQHGDELRELLDLGYTVKWGVHSDHRESFRNILAWQSQEALENGDCVEFHVYQDSQHGLTYKWVWLGYAKVATGNYRPIHLVLLVNPNNPIKKIYVATVYDPSIESWKWDETYYVRVCWK